MLFSPSCLCTRREKLVRINVKRVRSISVELIIRRRREDVDKCSGI